MRPSVASGRIFREERRKASLSSDIRNKWKREREENEMSTAIVLLISGFCFSNILTMGQ